MWTVGEEANTYNTTYLEGQERLTLRGKLAEDSDHVCLEEASQLGLHRGSSGCRGGTAPCGALEGLDGLDGLCAEVPPTLCGLPVLATVPHRDGHGSRNPPVSAITDLV